MNPKRTKKYFVLLVFFLGITMTIKAQMHNGKFGNEWINYTQEYYKIKVNQDGMYRLGSAALQNAGASVSTIHLEGLQLFCNGEEVPLYVQRTTSGTLDYIQFYGQRNRGEIDVNMYNDAADHFNQEYSLINDTATYFLTWGIAPSTSQYTNRSANLSALPAKENYYWHTSQKVYTNHWNKGQLHQVAHERLTKSIFEKGEGFGSNKSRTHTVTIATNHVVTTAPNATITVRAYADVFTNHNIEIALGTVAYANYAFLGTKVDDYLASVPAAVLQAANSVRVKGLAAGNDTYYLSHINIEYPHSFDFDGEYIRKFKLDGGSRKYLELNNMNSSNAANKVYLYDITNRTRTQCFWNAANNRALTDLPPAAARREMVLINEGNPSSYTNVALVEAVNFIDYGSVLYTPSNYVIITHPSLRHDSQGNNPIFDYMFYRQSPRGGGYTPISVDVGQLYDQFAYGVVRHPLALRHFVHYIKQNWTNPEYIFLIGKGLKYTGIRQLIPSNQLIPTFGYPPSDNVMMGSIHSDAPTIATGRLAATTGDQVSLYLQKIKDVEYNRQSQQLLDTLGWTKNILHLGGGRNSGEQNVIHYNLDNLKRIIEDVHYGANVQSFFKTSTNPIQSAQSSYLDSLINNGVSMITFYGHSSANSFDFNLDHPSNYTNDKKYPLIMALGCYGGTMYDQQIFISEKFIFEERAGAGVFLASVGAAALSALNIFSTQFYHGLANNHYNEGAAKSLKYAIERLESSGGYTTTSQMACNYMAYHGDPAFKVASAAYPDYYIDESLVNHSPNLVTAQMSTFDLELDIYNLGKFNKDTFNIRIERTFPDGTVDPVAASKRVVGAAFKQSISLPIQIGNANALGINYFNIYVDIDDEVDERPNPAAENNNTVLQYAVHILSDAVLPVYPYEFAIVPQDTISLKASTGNAFANPVRYRIQIDTTEYFNSNLLQQTTITQAGGLLDWTPSITYVDSTVYYWRVSVDSISPALGFRWNKSSFLYLDSTYPGWNQSHFFQFDKDIKTSILLEEPNRRFEYISTIQEVSATTAKTPQVLHHENVALYFNGSRLEQTRCPYLNGVYVAVIEPSTLDFWTIPGISGAAYYDLHGGINCDGAGRRSPNLLFRTNLVTKQDSLENFIKNIVPNGHYVLMYTLNNAYAHTWSPTLINTLKDEGAWYVDDLVNNTTNAEGLPWGFFFKKGDSTYTHKISKISRNPNGVLNISGLLQENWYQGNVKSTIIGPATSWNLLAWKSSDYDGQAQTDHYYVDVYGIDSSQNNRRLLLNKVPAGDTSLLSISAADYPYLELVWRSLDSNFKSSPQLDYWRIVADMVPEAAIRPEIYSSLDSSVMMQGQNLNFKVAMQNISAVDMDSILVKYQILGTPSPTIKYQRLAPLLVGDTLHGFVSFSTASLTGSRYQLLVEINPDSDQPEKYHFNNIGLVNFELRRDIVNPILDVTFDGIHIMNKDIVSGQPEIEISLLDENPFLGLNKIEDFNIILRHNSFVNGEMQLTPLTTDMQFFPADSSKIGTENRAKILINPNLIADGNYTLFVSAADRSGNNSGEMSYSVDFEVINKAAITHLLNYPNPFSTSTQFVFTLTGRELPDYMKIQILTVTGKVVREISMDELGALRIGINRTDYAWDGKDEYGDQLANGVYLYRVITKKDGQDYEHRGSRTDYMFRQGFGKMYLMR